MTIRKQYPARGYETFPNGEDSMAQSATSYQGAGDADKSRSAAAEARRLASQGSWGDNFGTPATDGTPVASTVDGNEAPEVRYPDMSQDDPSDPPPVYTPSVSTQMASQSPAAPASPVAARSVPVHNSEPVSASSTDPSSSSPPPSQSQPQDDVEGGPSSLPETVLGNLQERHNHQHHHGRHGHHNEEDADSDTLPVFMQQQRGCNGKWWRKSRKDRACGGRRHSFGHHFGQHKHDRHRGHWIKKACFFLIILIACLWLLVPGLRNSRKNGGRYQLPNFGSQPKPDPWPPVDREHRERETHNSISGNYKLYDLLDLSTTAGSISVTVDVQPGEKPAVLKLATTAGSVNVRMTTGGGLFKKRVVSEAAKSRVIQSEISSKAGSVSGNVVHGNGGTTTISTNAGSINLDIYAVGVSDMDAASKLSTATNQGSQHIRVYPDVTNTEPIRAIEASHSVRGSGSMTIDYPNEWEGMVHLVGYGSGSLGASGRGLVVRKESSHELYGYKGSKEGKTVEISELGSGSMRFSC